MEIGCTRRVWSSRCFTLLAEIHYRAQGIPRLINALSDNLLLTAFAMESKTATSEMLDEVTADMPRTPRYA